MKINKWLGSAALAAATSVLSTSVFAGLIVDTITQDVFLKTWKSYSYQHNLLDDGFILGSATAATLKIEISDDSDIWPEIVLFTVEKFDLDTDSFSFGSSFVGDLEVLALGALNADGLLGVTVTSLLGDFYVGDSTLTVTTAEVATTPIVTAPITAVPEPAIIGLLGLGLVALGFSRRRNKTA